MATGAPLALHTFAVGEGLPLVLLPAFPFDHRIWGDVAVRLPAGRTVLAVDPPGLGASPPADEVGRAVGAGGDPGLETAADAVAATLDAHGVGRAVVAGISMGGYTALALLERHPALVAGLALVDTRSTADDEAGRANRLRVADTVLAAGDVASLRGTPRTLLGPHNRGTAALVERVAGWIGDQPPAGVAWSQRAMAVRPDRTAVLAGLDGPALVLVGADDEVTPVPAAEHMAAALPDVELVVVPRCGHLSTVEDPAAVAAALVRLLDRVGAGV